MIKIESNFVGIHKGDVVLFSDFEHDGEMWTGDGPRLIREKIEFGDGFRSTPSVMVSLSMWDISNGANMRMDVQAENITPKGFDIVFRTWGDTKVARVRVAWQAIGSVKGDDVWDL